jgi:acyl-coenzyme A synthetase/AMP-(fatty) acid ligase
MSDTISDLLASAPDAAPALLAPSRATLTFAGLRQQQRDTVKRLNELGFGRSATVAIVMPNGPEMASAFVCVAAGATTAPLNPAYGQVEFEFYLADLDADLLIIQEGDATPARSAAEKLG